MTLDRKILTGFIACAVILVGVAIFSFKNSEKFKASNAWVDHTNQVLFEFQQILISSVDAETGVRGFVITGDGSFLEPYANAIKRSVEHLDKVKELTKDNPTQQKNIEELEKLLIAAEFYELEKSLLTENSQKEDFARKDNKI